MQVDLPPDAIVKDESLLLSYRRMLASPEFRAALAITRSLSPSYQDTGEQFGLHSPSLDTMALRYAYECGFQGALRVLVALDEAKAPKPDVTSPDAEILKFDSHGNRTNN